jgi:hypothetical protein
LSFTGEVVTSKFVKVLAEVTPEQGKEILMGVCERAGIEV